MFRPVRALAFLSLVVAASSQSIRPGSPADLAREADALFAATNRVVVTSAALRADAVTQRCGGVPEAIQFGVARGYLGANGFVLANSWVENQDEEQPPLPMLNDPTGCVDSLGVVGGMPSGGGCAGTDALLAATLLDPLGFAVTTEDAAVVTVAFDALEDTVLDVSYSLATFEDPTELLFYDSWGVFFDGALVAGGTTSGSPPPGTDPWTLAPSSAGPWEFNSLPIQPMGWVAPAHTTGLRTVSLDVPAGAHVLSFHVADGSLFPVEPSCGAASNNTVDTSLFVGLETFRAGPPGAPASRLGLSRRGHPAVAGGPFGDDLQLAVEGAAAGSVVLLGQSRGAIPAVSPPVLAGRSLLLDPSDLVFVTVRPASGTGVDLHPPTPLPVPPGAAGQRCFYQGWAWTPTSLEDSPGLALTF